MFLWKKNTHYFDETQLVCCQLAAEFTLVVKFAAGSNVLFIYFFFCISSETNLALNRQASLSILYQRKTFPWQKFWTAKQHVCRKNKLANQQDRWSEKCEMWLHSSKARVCFSSIFKKSINDKSCVAQMAFSFYSN